MNKNVEALYHISKKSSRRIVGLMSGTSLDGLDVAVCDIAGSGLTTQYKIVAFKTIPYTRFIKDEIRAVFAKQTIDFHKLVLLNESLALLHAKMVLNALQDWNIAAHSVDLIASHGQTVLHLPKTLHQQPNLPNATLQIGDGDHLAVATGIITISDFRQKHLAAGGEGAPLAVYGDYFLFSNATKSRIMLNIGGIANFTYLPKNQNINDVFVTDTGAGNTLIDTYINKHFPDKAFDKDAQMAKQGIVNDLLLQALKAADFFKNSFPKSTGPELFTLDFVTKAQIESHTTKISVCDVLATLTRFTAETIAEAILANIPDVKNVKVYVSGGGLHNPLLQEWLQELLPCQFESIDTLGVSADAKEALLFALLANETVAGNGFEQEKKSKTPWVSMGKISFPD
jgi:anhydro-N-acetylmuramic acid kinase